MQHLVERWRTISQVRPVWNARADSADAIPLNWRGDARVAPGVAAATHAVGTHFGRQLENITQSNRLIYEFGRLLVLLCCLLRDKPAESRSDVARPRGGPRTFRVFDDCRAAVAVAEIATQLWRSTEEIQFG